MKSDYNKSSFYYSPMGLQRTTVSQGAFARKNFSAKHC
jgi:hypothetical protein